MIEIREDEWLKEIEAMRPTGRIVIRWTPEMDRLILALGERADAGTITWATAATWWKGKGLRGGKQAIRRRYEELREKP